MKQKLMMLTVIFCAFTMLANAQAKTKEGNTPSYRLKYTGADKENEIAKKLTAAKYKEGKNTIEIEGEKLTIEIVKGTVTKVYGASGTVMYDQKSPGGGTGGGGVDCNAGYTTCMASCKSLSGTAYHNCKGHCLAQAITCTFSKMKPILI